MTILSIEYNAQLKLAQHMSTDMNKHTITNVLPRILSGSSPDQDEFLVRCDTIGSGSQLLCTHTSHRKYKQTQSNPQALTLHRATHLNCDDHGSRLRQHCQLALCVTQAFMPNSRIDFMMNGLCNCIHLTQLRIINPVVIL